MESAWLVVIPDVPLALELVQPSVLFVKMVTISPSPLAKLVQILDAQSAVALAQRPAQNVLLATIYLVLSVKLVLMKVVLPAQALALEHAQPAKPITI